jgi:hypothetical protein
MQEIIKDEVMIEVEIKGTPVKLTEEEARLLYSKLEKSLSPDLDWSEFIA